MSDTQARKRIKKLDVMVADVVAETPDTVTLVLFTGNDRLDYKPGHFLTIDPHQFEAIARWTNYLEDAKGRKEKPRAYSLASAPHEHMLAITIKEERYTTGSTPFPPLLSPLLVRRTPKGTRMQITGFTGPYVLPDDIEDRTEHVVHICAGSGVVPNWSILKHALHHDLKLRHTFIVGNKTKEDVIYRRELDELAEKHPDQLRVVNCLSRDSEANNYGPNYRASRVNDEVLKELIEDPSSIQVFMCGPAATKFEKKAAKERGEEPKPRFLDSALKTLQNLGLEKSQIHFESYG
jgi:3-ketosteroid 9alpha-monooxygenase subunit B